MKKRILPYEEGDWFGVPLREGGFAIGRLARVGKGGSLFGYFFGPSAEALPAENSLTSLKPSDAILRGEFSDLHLIEGKWPVIKNTKEWNRSHWPMPMFGRIDSDGKAWEVERDQNEPSRCIAERKSTAGRIIGLPKDSLMGAGFVEKRLSRLVQQSSPGSRRIA